MYMSRSNTDLHIHIVNVHHVSKHNGVTYTHTPPTVLGTSSIHGPVTNVIVLPGVVPYSDKPI